MPSISSLFFLIVLFQLLYTYRSCPKAEQLFDDFIKNSPELRRLELQYARLLKFLEEKAGLNRPLRIYDDVYEIYDPLLCEVSIFVS